MFERTDMIQITKAYKNHPKKGWLTTLVIFTSSCGAKHGEILSVLSLMSLCLCVRLACCQPLAPLVGKESLPMVRLFRFSELRDIT